jgi:glyoxylase-like metal-dependent hydrolase (beta-lactamase superfamily II)
VGIVTTHRHADHWGALADVVAVTGAPNYAGLEDLDAIPVPTTNPVRDGDHISVCDVTHRAIHLRGHTPGSIALLYDDPEGHPHLFTGDCLFPGGIGKTWSSADFDTLIDDVAEKVFGTLPDTTWVYPGHGDDTNLGNERPHLAEWRARRW